VITPHPPSLREGTFSHKGREEFISEDFYHFVSKPYRAVAFADIVSLHIGSKNQSSIAVNHAR
jgi:hypothetical protein